MHEDDAKDIREELNAAFRRLYGRDPEVTVRAPGRVNLLGAHVDYSEGWVTPATIDRAVHLAAAPAAGRTTRLHALSFGEDVSVELGSEERAGGWAGYPAGVAWALGREGYEPMPLDAVFGSELPIGSGVSSSAAVLVAFLLAWDALGGFALTKTESARLCRLAEDGYLGLKAGIMDPFGILHGRADHLVFLDCRTLDWRHVPLPAGTRVLVADSGVRRRLLDSGFNDRRAESTEAVEILQRYLPEVETLRDVTRQGYELYSHHLSVELRRRVLHVIEECERVHAGVAALERGDVDAFERLVRRSHLSSRDLYETTIPELDVLAAAAWSVEGCYGARLAGGGFGGSVNALASAEAAGAVGEAMRRAFRERFGREPEIFECAVGEGARVL